MNLTFDLYSRKTTLYYVAEVISIITIITIAACAKFNFQPHWPKVAEVITDVFIVIGIIIFLLFTAIAGYGMLKIYVKNGEMLLYRDRINGDDKEFIIDDDLKITFILRPRTNRSGWRRTGNRIGIAKGNEIVYKRFFCINSYEQNEELMQLLNVWSESGVIYKLSYTIF